MISFLKFEAPLADPNYSDGSKCKAFFILEKDGIQKRCLRGGLPLDAVEAQTYVMEIADHLFDNGEAISIAPTTTRFPTAEPSRDEIFEKILEIAQEGKAGPKKTLDDLKSEVVGAIDPIEIGGGK